MSLFKIDSADSCALLAPENKCSALADISDLPSHTEHCTIEYKTVSFYCSRFGEISEPD